MKTTIKIALLLFISALRFKAVKITMIYNHRGLAIQNFIGWNESISMARRCEFSNRFDQAALDARISVPVR
jgi:hypothetical protein